MPLSRKLLQNWPFLLCLHCRAPLWELTGLYALKIKVTSSLLLTPPNFLFPWSPCTKYHPVGPRPGYVHKVPFKDLIPSFPDIAAKLSPGWIPTKWPIFSCAIWNLLLRSHSNDHRKLVIAAEVANCAHYNLCAKLLFSHYSVILFLLFLLPAHLFFFTYTLCIFIAYNTDTYIYMCVDISLYLYRNRYKIIDYKHSGTKTISS